MADIRINALATTATTPASDDYLALDGAAQGTRKILATNIANNVTDVILGTSGPSVKSSLSARAPRQGLVFDGTSGTSIANSTAFGTSDFTVAAIVNGTSFATVPRLFGGAANSFALLVTSGGALQSSLQSSSDNTASTGTLTAGKINFVAYVRSGTTGTYYINGVAAGTTTDSRNYSVATTFLGATLSLTTVPWIGAIDGVSIYNRALSASEVVALYEAGSPYAISTTGLLLAPDATQAGGGLTWYDTSGNAANITLPASGVSWNVPSSRYLGGNWTTSGNLTVSGTDYNYVGGNKFFRGFTNYNILYTGATELSINNQADGANLASFKNNGNLLLGTAIDGGQKLQVSGTAAISGALSTTDVITNTVNSQEQFVLVKPVTGTFSPQQIVFKQYDANSASQTVATINTYKTTNTAGAINGQLVLVTSNAGTPTAALTLDSSQNATFAGDATWNKNGNIIVTLATASTSSGATNRLKFATPTSTSDTRCGVIEFYKNGSTFNGDLRFNVAGGIALRNSADTVTFETDDNKNFVLNSGAIATNATNGFIYVATCAGTPTGTPTSYTGRAPIVVDTTNNKLYFYSGGAWRDAGP